MGIFTRICKHLSGAGKLFVCEQVIKQGNVINFLKKTRKWTISYDSWKSYHSSCFNQLIISYNDIVSSFYLFYKCSKKNEALKIFNTVWYCFVGIQTPICYWDFICCGCFRKNYGSWDTDIKNSFRKEKEGNYYSPFHFCGEREDVVFSGNKICWIQSTNYMSDIWLHFW